VKSFLTFAAFIIGGLYAYSTTADWVAAFFTGGILAFIVNKAYKFILVVAAILVVLLIISAI